VQLCLKKYVEENFKDVGCNNILETVNSDRSNCKINGQPIIQYTMDMEKIKMWLNIITAANKLESDPSSVTKACNGERKKTRGGYYFRG